MRRALVLISVFGAALLGTGPTLAAATAGAAPAARPRPEIEREVELRRIPGRRVRDRLSDNDADEVSGDLTVTAAAGRLLHGPGGGHREAGDVASSARSANSTTGSCRRDGGTPVPRRRRRKPGQLRRDLHLHRRAGLRPRRRAPRGGSVIRYPAPTGCPSPSAGDDSAARRPLPPGYSRYGVTLDAKTGSPGRAAAAARTPRRRRQEPPPAAGSLAFAANCGKG